MHIAKTVSPLLIIMQIVGWSSTQSKHIVTKEENVMKCRRYIAYRRQATQHLMEISRRADFLQKNRQKIGDISAISDKSTILRKNRLEHQLIANFLAIFLRKIFPLSNVIWWPKSHPCWSDDHIWISTVIKRSNG